MSLYCKRFKSSKLGALKSNSYRKSIFKHFGGVVSLSINLNAIYAFYKELEAFLEVTIKLLLRLACVGLDFLGEFDEIAIGVS